MTERSEVIRRLSPFGHVTADLPGRRLRRAARSEFREAVA